MAKQKRLEMHLRWYAAGRCWRLYEFRRWVVEHSPRITKREAEKYARRRARGIANEGRPVQLLIHNKRQNIGKGGAREASYGCDSKRAKG